MQGWYNMHKSINVIHHINKRKDKNHMIIPIDVEKEFDKVQHPFMMKILSNVGVEGPFQNVIKETYSQHLTQQATTKSFPAKIRNKTRMSTFTIFIQQSIGSSSHSNQTRRNKRHPNGKGGSKTVTVCRLYNSVYRKPHRIHPKNTRANK